MKEYKNYINGLWTASSDHSTEVVLNPATEESIASVPQSTARDADCAVRAAAAAFPGWSKSTPGVRSRMLLKLADRIESHAEQLANLESLNVGKPLSVASDDIEFAVDNLRFFAGAARMLEGKASAEYIPNHTSLIRREPLGVVASIAPWNYPFLMAIWKIGPALAAGNTVVLKPSEITPLSAFKLAELSADILPVGVLNVIAGHGVSVGAALVAHPQVAMVSLTGDTETGREILRAASQTIKKVHLELGGKAPAIVFEDADLEWASERLRRSGFYNSGQDCTAATRIIVHKQVVEKLLQLLEREIQQIRLGDPSQPETTTGPLVSRQQQDKVSQMVDNARQTGADVVTGGRKPGGKGYFYLPTVIRGVQQLDEIVQKEVFGPVLTVQTFDAESEALALANGVSYGLTASVWTQNISRAMRIANKLQAGTVWINDHTRLTPEMPHGGTKQSGYGKDMSLYSLEEYTQIKHVMIKI